jgi:hypothetical protein
MSGAAMRRDRRRWGQWLLAAAPLLGACYVYRPLMTPEPQPDARLAFDLTDQGQAALVTSVGSDVAHIEGALVSETAEEYVIRVSDVFTQQGTRTKWNGELVTFRREYVKRIRERRFSGGRTAATVAGVLGAVVGLAAGTHLAGFGNGGSDRPGSGVGDGQ